MPQPGVGHGYANQLAALCHDISVLGRVLASYPGPSRGGEGVWYTLHAYAQGDPRKSWGNRILPYTLRLSSIENACHAKRANGHYGHATGHYGDQLQRMHAL